MTRVSTFDAPAQPALKPPIGAVSNLAAREEAAVPDPQLVAEMRHEIRVLVEEITQLATQSIAPAEFYAGFLTRVVSALAAVGGAIWTRGEHGHLRLEHAVNLPAAGFNEKAQTSAQHLALLKSVLSGTQAILVPPGTTSTAEKTAGNATEHLLVLAPLVLDQEAQAVVGIFQRPGGSPSTQRGYLRFLVQMADVACDYLKAHRLRELEEHQSLWRQLEEFVIALHGSLSVEETAYAVVNEGRRLIGCDRVSLGLCVGWGCRIQAISGLDSIDRRAAEVQRLSRLAKAVLQTREPLWSEAGDEELPPQIHAPLQSYIDQSHARLIGVLPIFAQSATHAPSGDAQPIGAIIVEQLRDARAGESLRKRADVVAHHSAAALANAIEHSRVFLLPLWKAIGRATWFLRGRALPMTLAAVAALAAAIYALAVVPADFEIAARGKLQPAERQEVFAPLDGVIRKVTVEHGQMVDPGTVLAELTNTDLDLQIATVLGRQTTNQERLTALQRAMLDTKGGAARLTPVDENRLAGEMMQLKQEAENIDRELALLREKERQLRVVAPRRGQVVTWKVRDLLLQRPVSRGQGLLTLANPDGPWELELNLPERRLAHVQRAQSANANSSIPVTFFLASNPGQVFGGRVVEIEQAAEVRGDEGNTVLVRVAVDMNGLPGLHDQTTVVAKLDCGRASIGYVWFCDLIETIQNTVLFWLPS